MEVQEALPPDGEAWWESPGVLLGEVDTSSTYTFVKVPLNAFFKTFLRWPAKTILLQLRTVFIPAKNLP